MNKPAFIKNTSPVKYRERAIYQCSCGNLFAQITYNVKKSRSTYCSTSCEQLKKHNSESHTKHNMSFSREYCIWRGIKKRCYDKKNQAYPSYGGRGIKVCDRWVNSFNNFYADMGEQPTDKHTIDRIDNSKGYDSSNCRWATMKEQQRNRRNTIFVKCSGSKIRLTEYAEQNQVTYSSAYMRLHRGKLEGVTRL